ncbi:MAG: phosphotransferase [Acidimicrobiales bacterium]
MSQHPSGAGTALADRYRWLAEQAPATVELVSSAADSDWLVTTRLAGHAAHRVDAHGDMQGVPATLARALRQLHDQVVDVDDFPFAAGWDDLAADVTASIADLDPSTLPDPYARYDAERLAEIWREGRPGTEDIVLCHGDPSLPNLLIDPGVVGWVDVGRLRLADRHLDLAVAQYSIHRNFGPDAVFAFFEAYDLDPDLVRIDHYLLANFLLP